MVLFFGKTENSLRCQTGKGKHDLQMDGPMHPQVLGDKNDQGMVVNSWFWSKPFTCGGPEEVLLIRGKISFSLFFARPVPWSFGLPCATRRGRALRNHCHHFSG